MFIIGARVEEFMFEKFDRKTPMRPANSFVLGQTMVYAGRELGAGTEYGNDVHFMYYISNTNQLGDLAGRPIEN